MCGIAGYVGEGSEADLKKMISAMAYRGPDYFGFLNRGKVGFGHARLSVIDTSDFGRQPMETADKTVAVVFNGEIYNFQELRASLSKKHRFVSKTDTEVILYAYKEYGEKCFEKLDGMFAIALYDFDKNKLILTRDRMGKKPLYWSLSNKSFVFASELTSLLMHTCINKEIDHKSLYEYFSYDYVPSPRSLIKGVYKLEPATYLTFQNGMVHKEVYWKPHFEEIDIPETEAIRQLNHLLGEAVKKRLVADVPLGIFLSGGLDSSAIAFYATRLNTKKIKTFSIGFDDKSFDESDHANYVAKTLDTDHYVKLFKTSEAVERIPEILETLDEPIGDASVIPTFLLSEFARTNLTVALGGDGGDELFAGYPTFQVEKIAGLFNFLPISLKRLIRKGVHTIKPSYKNFGLDFTIKKLMDGWESASPVLRHMNWLGSFTDTDKGGLFSDNFLEGIGTHNTFESANKYFDEHKEVSVLNRLLYLYQRTYMMDGVLSKVDRASMRASLEVRTPFLDQRVVEFANSLPYSYKLKGLTTKYLLKKMMNEKLPAHIIHRKKKGFGMPIAELLRGDLKNFCDTTLSSDYIKNGGVFNNQYVEKLKLEHFGGKHDHRKKLWDLIVFEIWRKKHLV